MGTAILRSQDCLQGRYRNDALALATSWVRSRTSSSAYHNLRRRRSPVSAVHANHHRDRSRSGDRSPKGLATTNLVMGQIKMLKRREKLNLDNNHRGLAVHAKNRVKSVENFNLLLGSTDRLGTDPVTVQKQIRVPDPKEGIYAGSGFITSPPPSCVPVPGFLRRNGAATSDLRRLLRLDD